MGLASLDPSYEHWSVTKVNVPFIGVLLLLLMLVTYVPAVPMSLVELFYR